MSIQIVDNFKLNLNKPIDSRMVTTGVGSRNKIRYKYEGLRVYDIVDKAPYVYIDSAWQKESSSGGSSGSSSGGGSSIPVGTTNRIVKYTSSTTVGESTIVDKGTFLTPNVGIGMAPVTGFALDVKGMFRSIRFMGALNGVYLDTASLDISKIIPHNVAVGEFTLKSIAGNVVWTSATSLNTDIVINNQTSDGAINYLLFSNTSNNISTGVPIYANKYDSTRLIGIKPSTSQILGSGDISINTSNAPSYTFSNNTTAGLYGNNTEVGLTFNDKALLKLTSSKLSIYDTIGTEVMYTGSNKVIFPVETQFSTLNVTGTTTLSSLKVNTGTTTFTSLSFSTLNVTGTTTLSSLIVNTTSVTTFSSFSTNSITSTNLITNNLSVSNTTTLASLSLTTLNVLDTNGLGAGYGVATFTNLTVGGIGSSITFQNPINGPLTINTPVSGANALAITGTLKLTTGNNSYPTIEGSIDLNGYANLSRNGTSGKYFQVQNTTGKSNFLDGTGNVECSKLKMYKAQRPSATTWFDTTNGVPINGTPVFYSDYEGTGQAAWAYPPTQAGYEAGDIVYVEWVKSGYTDSSGYHGSTTTGEFCFYRGRKQGWGYLGDQGFLGTIDNWPNSGGSAGAGGVALPPPPPPPPPPSGYTIAGG